MRRLLTIIALALLTLIQAFAQDWSTRDMKSWSDGPLKLSDFSLRNAHDSSTVGYLSWTYIVEPERQKVGNLKYNSYRVELMMDKLTSWYDPSWSSNVLSYFQTDFDMGEAIRRRLQNEVNRNPAAIQEVTNYYYRLIDNKIGAYVQETRNGHDKAVIEKYAAEVAAELDTLKIEPVRVPKFQKKKGGIGIYAGYGAEIFSTPASAGMPIGHSLNWGFDFPIARWSILLDMNLGFRQYLKTDSFYYDDKYDYTWKQDAGTNNSSINIIGGYHIIDSDYIAVMPMAGFGTGFMNQQINVDQREFYDTYASEMSGFRLLAGVQFAAKFSRTLSYDGIPSIGESSVKFHIYGATTDFHQIGRSFSLNFGITVDWTGFKVK